MSLTTETVVMAIAKVQAAYNCSDLDAITRMQGASAKAGDEASLEVLCAIKAELIAQVAGPFKIQTLTNDGIWKESGALMNFDSGDWEPTVFATKAEGLAAAAKHWGDLALFCRAVVVGSADDLAAVISQKVMNAKCLNKNANGYARHGNTKEAARLRAKRDAYMATARAAAAVLSGAPAAVVKDAETVRNERAERLTIKPAPIDWAFVDSIDPEHQAQLELALRMRSLLDMRADFTARGKLVLLAKTNDLIDCLCDSVEGSDSAPVCDQAAPAAPVMNAFRNLYKIRNEKRDVVAFVTSGNADGARGKYHGAGGQVEVVTAEQVSTGYDKHVCTIYA